MTSIMENSSSERKLLPFVLMIVVQLVLIGSITLSKAAMMEGLSQYVYIVYYEALGTMVLLPWFVCHCFSGKRLPLTFSLMCRFFVLSLIGNCVSPICLCTALSYTSVTVGAAIGNLTPIFTFLIAICMGMERLNLRKSIDQIKVVGTLVAVLGAFVVTLYKGPPVLPSHGSASPALRLDSEQPNWPLGGALFTLGFLLRSIWNILQADTAKSYPDEVTIVFFCNLFGTLQTALAAFFMVKGPDAWQLHSKVQIIATIYSAVALGVIISTVLTWCLRKKGAVFVTMFDPLNVALAAFMGFVFLADGIYLGSVIGSTAIIVGFYAVMWGQAKTTSVIVDKLDGLESASCTNQVTPLLESYKD